jgi:hypothetical protein
MEAVESYRIPVETPKDLIEEYFRLMGTKCRVLDGSRGQNRKLSKRSARTSSNGLGYQ